MNKGNGWAGRASIPQIRTMILMNYLEVARLVGAEPYELLKHAGIHADLLQEPDSRLAASAVVRLIEETARVSQCETFGLLLCEQCALTSLGPIGLVLQLEPTVRDAVRSLEKYLRLFNNILSFELDERSRTAIMQLGLLPGFASRQLIEAILGQTVQAIRAVSGSRWQPESVHLRHAAPADRSVHKRIFQCPIEFDAAFDGLVFAPESLDVRNPLGNAGMVAHAKKYVEMLSGDQETASISNQVRHAINQLIGSGSLSTKRVATSLAINPRKLQRMLDDEGTNFGLLLNESRRDLSFRYITSSSKCILEISELLGYANASSFSRWFTREFGRAPVTLRNDRYRKGLMDEREAERHVAFCSTGRCALETTGEA